MFVRELLDIPPPSTPYLFPIEGILLSENENQEPTGQTLAVRPPQKFSDLASIGDREQAVVKTPNMKGVVGSKFRWPRHGSSVCPIPTPRLILRLRGFSLAVRVMG